MSVLHILENYKGFEIRRHDEKLILGRSIGTICVFSPEAMEDTYERLQTYTGYYLTGYHFRTTLTNTTDVATLPFIISYLEPCDEDGNLVVAFRSKQHKPPNILRRIMGYGGPLSRYFDDELRCSIFPEDRIITAFKKSIDYIWAHPGI